MRHLIVIGLVVFGGCAVAPSVDFDDREIAQVMIAATPISSPLRMIYSASNKSISTRLGMRFAVNAKSFDSSGVANITISTRSGQLLYEGAFINMTANGKTLSCSNGLPLMTMNAALNQYGVISGYNVVETSGCEASAQAVAGATDFDIRNSLWLFPPDGVQTGTVLRRPPSSNPNLRLGDSRGTVLGREVWRGQDVIAVRIDGCHAVRGEAGDAWVPFCNSGVILVSIATGLPVGGVARTTTEINGVRLSAAMRSEPL